MFLNLLLAFLSTGATAATWLHAGAFRGLAAGFAALGAWQLYCAFIATRRPAVPVVLRLGGFCWAVEDFCRGWLITCQVGTGKTSGAINTMLWQVSKNLLAGT